MNLVTTVRGKVQYRLDAAFDRAYLRTDKAKIRTTTSLQLIPPAPDRRGGKASYAEWAHVSGIFQTLLCLHAGTSEDLDVLDVGCGTGLLAVASSQFLGEKGRYVGLDVRADDVDFCRRHYPSPRFQFHSVDAKNSMYNESGTTNQPWDLTDESFDMVLALSVWTHFNEADARYWMNEVSRVLRPGGKAIITFLLLDELYRENVLARPGTHSRFNSTRQTRWTFDQPAYGSEDWFCPSWARTPEIAIGVSSRGLESLLADSNLELEQIYPGNWKDVPAVYFQDVVVVQRP